MSTIRFAAIILIIAVLLSLPGARGAEAQAPALAAPAVVPAGGSWQGTNDQGRPVSFTVNSAGTQWTNFSLQILISMPPPCSGVMTITIEGPGTITANGFGWSNNNFSYSFSGKFNSPTTASGTYDFFAYPNPYCGGAFSQSGTWTASLPPIPPGAFGKGDPDNAATNQPLSVLLYWTSSSGATKYEYCYDSSNNNACDGVWTDSGGYTLDIISGLSPLTTYYWQVRASNDYGTTYADGAAASWWSFTTGLTPTAFGKSAPLNDATNQPTNTVLNWTASPDATGYEYCIDPLGVGYCGTSWTTVPSGTSVDPPGAFARGKTYYWQVRALNAIGATYADGGEWWSFTTIPPLKTTYYSRAAQDGDILESSEKSEVGGTVTPQATTFTVGDHATRKQYRAILSFDTSSIPDGAVIVSATLRVRRAGGSPTNPFAMLGGLVVDIKKGAFGTALLQPADFQAPASKAAALSLPATPLSGYYIRAVPPVNLAYINKVGLTQFRLRFIKDDDNDNVADFIKLYSGNCATVDSRPALIVEFYVP